MKADEVTLTAEQYNTLYCAAFAKLDTICTLAEQAMKELEEIQLSMGDGKAEREKIS